MAATVTRRPPPFSPSRRGPGPPSLVVELVPEEDEAVEIAGVSPLPCCVPTLNQRRAIRLRHRKEEVLLRYRLESCPQWKSTEKWKLRDETVVVSSVQGECNRACLQLGPAVLSIPPQGRTSLKRFGSPGKDRQSWNFVTDIQTGSKWSSGPGSPPGSASFLSMPPSLDEEEDVHVGGHSPTFLPTDGSLRDDSLLLGSTPSLLTLLVASSSQHALNMLNKSTSPEENSLIDKAATAVTATVSHSQPFSLRKQRKKRCRTLPFHRSPRTADANKQREARLLHQKLETSIADRESLLRSIRQTAVNTQKYIDRWSEAIDRQARMELVVSSAVDRMETILCAKFEEMRFMISHLRELSVDIVASHFQWQDLLKVSSQYVQVEEPPANKYKWKGTNYLLKMSRDMEALDALLILKDWLGFSPLGNPLLIPPQSAGAKEQEKSKAMASCQVPKPIREVMRKRGKVIPPLVSRPLPDDICLRAEAASLLVLREKLLSIEESLQRDCEMPSHKTPLTELSDAKSLVKFESKKLPRLERRLSSRRNAEREAEVAEQAIETLLVMVSKPETASETKNELKEEVDCSEGAARARASTIMPQTISIAKTIIPRHSSHLLKRVSRRVTRRQLRTNAASVVQMWFRKENMKKKVNAACVIQACAKLFILALKGRRRLKKLEEIRLRLEKAALNAAAAEIQRFFRYVMYLRQKAHKEVERVRKLKQERERATGNAAQMLQKIFRAHVARRRVKNLRMNRLQTSATRIQAHFRGHRVRRKMRNQTLEGTLERAYAKIDSELAEPVTLEKLSISSTKPDWVGGKLHVRAIAVAVAELASVQASLAADVASRASSTKRYSYLGGRCDSSDMSECTGWTLGSSTLSASSGGSKSRSLRDKGLQRLRQQRQQQRMMISSHKGSRSHRIQSYLPMQTAVEHTARMEF